MHNYNMFENTQIFIFSDQPATCPKCGIRNEIVLDLIDAPEFTQYHRCTDANCAFEFVMQCDMDFE
jgi:hypothetical protein